MREHVKVNRARVLAQIEALVQWALERSDGSGELDAQLTARSIRDWSEQAARMVLTDPDRYSPERYERYVKDFLALLTGAPSAAPTE